MLCDLHNIVSCFNVIEISLCYFRREFHLSASCGSTFLTLLQGNSADIWQRIVKFFFFFFFVFCCIFVREHSLSIKKLKSGIAQVSEKVMSTNMFKD